jgi:4,5-DOPA dioxygenase extradiol
MSSLNSELMPVGFIGHGAPTLGLEKKGPTIEAWKKWGASLPSPKAILVVSAHWLDRPPHLGPTRATGLIYDFYGFPAELYQVQYPAPPAPELAKEVFSLLGNAGLKPIESPSRGLDHGTWVPLFHMFPNADIPVLQVSIGTRVPMAEHLALGKALAPLRSEGIFILGSGNLTHNLNKVNFADRYGEPESWAKEFDTWAVEKLEAFDLEALARYATEAPSARQAHPTDDHYTPLLVAAAAASVAGPSTPLGAGKPSVRYPHEGFEYGTLSMRCVEFTNA